MHKEYFDPLAKKTFKIHSFEIKPVKYRRVFYTYLNELVIDCCLNCKKAINYGDYHFKGYKNRHDQIVLRPSCAYGQICLDCGIEILKSITPKKLLHRFEQLNLLKG